MVGSINSANYRYVLFGQLGGSRICHIRQVKSIEKDSLESCNSVVRRPLDRCRHSSPYRNEGRKHATRLLISSAFLNDTRRERRTVLAQTAPIACKNILLVVETLPLPQHIAILAHDLPQLTPPSFGQLRVEEPRHILRPPASQLVELI